MRTPFLLEAATLGRGCARNSSRLDGSPGAGDTRGVGIQKALEEVGIHESFGEGVKSERPLTANACTPLLRLSSLAFPASLHPLAHKKKACVIRHR